MIISLLFEYTLTKYYYYYKKNKAPTFSQYKKEEMAAKCSEDGLAVRANPEIRLICFILF